MLATFLASPPTPAAAQESANSGGVPNAQPPRVVRHAFDAPGTARYLLEGGYVVEFTAGRPAGGRVGQAKPLADSSNNVTVGINMYDPFGVLLWRFSENVAWSWNGSAVTSDFPELEREHLRDRLVCREQARSEQLLDRRADPQGQLCSGDDSLLLLRSVPDEQPAGLDQR